MYQKQEECFTPVELRCNYTENPIGIGSANPRFTWKASDNRRGQSQSAYEIIVSSNIENMLKGNGDMWASGKIESSQSVNIIYNGKTLESRKIYFWKVRFWDAEGQESRWSTVAFFEMGLLHPWDWKSEWIKAPVAKKNSVPMFRRVFNIEKQIKSARAYICGLGYYEPRINGSKAGDHVLDPGWTDYSKRILYETFDVGNLLRPGQNTLGVMLGTGWYQQPKSPQMIAQLHILYEDNTEDVILSKPDSEWMVSTSGPIIENSIYNGEVYDARREMEGWDTSDYFCSEHDWKTPLLAESPGGKLIPQELEPIKVMQEIKPVKITNPKSEVYVYDLGQNISGWARLKVKGPAGTEVIMKFAELIHSDGTINQENLRLSKVEDKYILRGKGSEIYEPRFTYHGFRYIQVEGYPGEPDLTSITGCVVRSSVEQTGYFQCSNHLINQIQNNVIWSEATNLHSVPTDCPQRNERFGWLNDMTVRAEEGIYNFNMSRFYAKWEDDIADTQGEKTGAITDTAPFIRFGNQPADPVSSVYLIIPWLLYLHYGDISILKEHYEGMKKWVRYLGIHTDNHIINYSYWGDWASPITETVTGSVGAGALSAKTPGSLMSTGYYYFNAVLMAKIALILGEIRDKEYFDDLAEKIKQAFNQKFFCPKNNQYAAGSQASNVFPLYLGLVPKNRTAYVAENIAKDVIAHGNHLTTGNLCTKYIMEVLMKYGYEDTAFALATQTTYPSWGYMISMGATTIWERWEYATGGAMNSHNHPMYGTISTWFYKYLAGIQVDENGPGFHNIVIKPYVRSLEYVQCSLVTVRGKVVSNWKKTGNKLVLDITIPWNCSAKLYVPLELERRLNTIIEGNQLVWSNKANMGMIDEVYRYTQEGKYVVFHVGSGMYSFKCNYDFAAKTHTNE